MATCCCWSIIDMPGVLVSRFSLAIVRIIAVSGQVPILSPVSPKPSSATSDSTKDEHEVEAAKKRSAGPDQSVDPSRLSSVTACSIIVVVAIIAAIVLLSVPIVAVTAIHF